MSDEPELRPPDEDEVRAAADGARRDVGVRLWAAYDGWAWAPDTEKEWLVDYLKVRRPRRGR